MPVLSERYLLSIKPVWRLKSAGSGSTVIQYKQIKSTAEGLRQAVDSEGSSRKLSLESDMDGRQSHVMNLASGGGDTATNIKFRWRATAWLGRVSVYSSCRRKSGHDGRRRPATILKSGDKWRTESEDRFPLWQHIYSPLRYCSTETRFLWIRNGDIYLFLGSCCFPPNAITT